MPVEADIIYRTREQIVNDAIQRMQSRVPDIWTDADGMFRLFWETAGEIIEGVYLANEILRDNIFIQTANLVELRRHGEQFGLTIKPGTFATGTLLLSGAPGTVIAVGSEVAAEPIAGTSLFYRTTAQATIPAPGLPPSPTTADAGVGNPPAGTYEYVVSFLTAAGETIPGPASTPLTTSAAHQINVTNIPLGGAGTTGRRLYRQRNGGGYKLVTTINDNTTTTFVDNLLDAALGGVPLTTSTALAVSVPATAEVVGIAYNALPGTITQLANITDAVTTSTNLAAFTGGSDEEDMEDYRQRLLQFVRSPHTGSKADLEFWALEIDGVEMATAFPNDNLGVATPGHVTTRVAGPDGVVPVAAVVDAVLANQQAKDLANVTLHVTTFTPVATNVTVSITLVSGYILADVTLSVQQAITDYINSVPVGGTVYMAGLIDAVFGLPGVATVILTTPATDQTATATQKRVPGVITVS